MINLKKIPSLNNKLDILGNEKLNQEVEDDVFKSYIIETIPDEYKKSKFSSLPENLKNAVDNEKPFFITGPAGTGKTFAAWGIYKYLNFTGRECYMIDFDTLLDNIQDAKFGRESLFTLEDVEKYQGTLVIDDFGTRGESAFTNNIIRRIISKRAEWHKPTGFTSNLKIEDLSEKFDDRITSRILGYYKIIKFDGKDLRLS